VAEKLWQQETNFLRVGKIPHEIKDLLPPDAAGTELEYRKTLSVPKENV
jgi:hypothetical protein